MSEIAQRAPAMPSVLIPPNERERLNGVRRYEILDPPLDGAFDWITAPAARIFDVPISIVSIVDSDRIWFKSRHAIGVGIWWFAVAGVGVFRLRRSGVPRWD